MANVDMNALTQHLQGRVGDMVFRKMNGRMHALLRPRLLRRPPPSANQIAQQGAVKDALSYAKRALADPESRAVYEQVALVKQKSARALAVGDFFNPPAVRRITLTDYAGRVGDKISIAAEDDVAVRRVGVIIRRSDGTILEQGPAVAQFDAWQYTATTAIPDGTNLIIEVTATDWAGNQGKANKLYP